MQVVPEVNFVTEQKPVFSTISLHLPNGGPADFRILIDGRYMPIRIIFPDKWLGQRQINEYTLLIGSLLIKPNGSYTDRITSLSILCGSVKLLLGITRGKS